MLDVNKSQAIRDYYKANPTAKTSEVVDALAKKDITVSVNLVNTVKSKHNKRRAAKRAATSKGNGVLSVAGKKPEVNKSEAIRDYYKANPKAKTSEVIEGLGRDGISVSSNLVTTVRSKHNKRRRAVRKVVAKGGVGIAELKSALAFIKSVGGIQAANRALEVAQEIKAIV